MTIGNSEIECVADYWQKISAVEQQLQNEREFLQTLDAGGVTGICLYVAMREANAKTIGEVRKWHEDYVDSLELKKLKLIKRSLKNGNGRTLQ